jgi:ligand-binding SRPBCC domain-containing protein
MYTLEREQVVHTSLAEAWNFLRDPSNLNRITPDDLNFQIITPIPTVMFNGLLVEYRIKIPLFGKRQWIAEIKHIREFHSFVDEQRVGPYSFWYHYHGLNEVEHGVRLFDRVYYDVPWSFAGRLLHVLVIRETLNRIFDYRSKQLAKIFNC